VSSRYWLMFASTIVCVGCSNSTSLQSPPLRISFDTSDPFAMLETKFRVNEFRSYSVGFEYSFDKNSVEQHEKFEALINKTAPNRGHVPIAIQLNISPIEPSAIETVFDKLYSNQQITSWGDSILNTQFDKIRLKPGTYHLVVINRSPVGNPNLGPIHFVLAGDPKSTPIRD